NFSIFITDPLAILSYPSDANAFYIAILCSAITIVTLLKRRKLSMALFMHAFIYIFVIASFVYELIHIVWNDYTYQIGYFTLITLLIIALISLSDNVPLYWLNIGMILAWTIGSFGLIMNLPIVMVFGYTMMPGFFIFITMITLFLIMYQNRRDVINEWELNRYDVSNGDVVSSGSWSIILFIPLCIIHFSCVLIVYYRNKCEGITRKS